MLCWPVLHYCSIYLCQHIGIFCFFVFFTLPRWGGMSDGRQTPLSSTPPAALWESQGGWRMKGKSVCSSILPQDWSERASDADLRKWRCRKAEFSQGEFQQGYMHSRTYKHTRELGEGITLIFLTCQQLGSVCAALTPAKPNLLLGFLCYHLVVSCIVWCAHCPF